MRIDRTTGLLISGIIMAICVTGSAALAQSPSSNNSSQSTNPPRKEIHTDQSYKFRNAESEQNNNARYNGSHNSAWPGGTHTPAGFEKDFKASGNSGGNNPGNR